MYTHALPRLEDEYMNLHIEDEAHRISCDNLEQDAKPEVWRVCTLLLTEVGAVGRLSSAKSHAISESPPFSAGGSNATQGSELIGWQYYRQA